MATDPCATHSGPKAIPWFTRNTTAAIPSSTGASERHLDCCSFLAPAEAWDVLVNPPFRRRFRIILTSNKSYGDWGSIFGDPIIATAILDRSLHHSTAINIRGDSYRLKHR